MAKYKFPASNGVIGEIEIYDPKEKTYKKAQFRVPKDVKIVSWVVYNDCVVVETEGEVKEWQKYQI